MLIRHRLQRTPPVKSIQFQSGALMLEVLLSILIFAVGILAVVALQARSVSTLTQSQDRANASLVSSQTLGFLWSRRNIASSFIGTYTGAGSSDLDKLAKSLPNGTIIVANATGSTSDYIVTIRWRAPGQATNSSFVVSGSINSSD